jgi:DNA-binding GntR family transcriptional regulator
MKSIKTVTEQLYIEIRDEILSGELEPGEKLTIKKLHERYGVSSSPIREALTRLQQDGLIEYRPNIGMSVIELTKKDLQEIFDLTIELDIIAMKFAMRAGKRDELISELDKIQDESRRCSADDSRWNELSDMFHLVFYDHANNSRLSNAAANIRMQFTIFSNAYEKVPENKDEIIDQHETVLDRLRGGDMEGAEAAMRTHLESSHAKALQVLEERDRENDEKELRHKKAVRLP